MASCYKNIIKIKIINMDTVLPASAQAMSSAKPKINWKYEIQQYATAFTTLVPFYAALSVYLFFRRGYYDLYIANKAFAGVAAIGFGIVLLLGPGSRMFSFPDRYVQYRKEVGIIAFFLALIHSLVSLFFLPSKFSFASYFNPITLQFIFGLTAILLLIALFAISNHWASNAIGQGRWWRIQYWGVRSAFVLVCLHVFIMKLEGWVGWYKVGGGKGLVRPEWPGAGILVAWFMAFVVLVRVAEFISPKLGKVAWYTSAVALPLIYIATFWWGRQFVR